MVHKILGEISQVFSMQHPSVKQSDTYPTWGNSDTQIFTLPSSDAYPETESSKLDRQKDLRFHLLSPPRKCPIITSCCFFWTQECTRDLPKSHELPEMEQKWIVDMLEYNVKGGKMNRGLMVPWKNHNPRIMFCQLYETRHAFFLFYPPHLVWVGFPIGWEYSICGHLLLLNSPFLQWQGFIEIYSNESLDTSWQEFRDFFWGFWTWAPPNSSFSQPLWSYSHELLGNNFHASKGCPIGLYELTMFVPLGTPIRCCRSLRVVLSSWNLKVKNPQMLAWKGRGFHLMQWLLGKTLTTSPILQQQG